MKIQSDKMGQNGIFLKLQSSVVTDDKVMTGNYVLCTKVLLN